MVLDREENDVGCGETVQNGVMLEHTLVQLTDPEFVFEADQLLVVLSSFFGLSDGEIVASGQLWVLLLKADRSVDFFHKISQSTRCGIHVLVQHEIRNRSQRRVIAWGTKDSSHLFACASAARRCTLSRSS